LRALNPILPGCHPDPSICRVEDDFYLVTSTFEYFPGLPVHHSRDLVRWRLVGHVLDRPSQLPLDGVRPSGGLFAPTIRHHRGTFYVACTLVGGGTRSGNFVVTAPHPAGPWSEPTWLEDADGFDPSLLFDEDGRAWFHACRQVSPEAYFGETEVWLRELDLSTLALVGDEHVLWRGALRNVVWVEGPHLYRVGGRYLLLAAEGGTEHNHAVTVARADRVTGPYEGSRRNPVLTHRHLGRGHPVVGPGHADLVETSAGEWWAVLLAMRPYGGYTYNLGRETFLVPVIWEEGWPVFCPGVGQVPLELEGPALPAHPWPAEPARDDFDAPVLAAGWSQVRTPREECWSLSERPGHLRLRLRPESLADRAHPSFVGRPQQHMRFAARAALEFVPANEDECAGLVARLSEDFHLRLVGTLHGERVVRGVRRREGRDETLGEAPVAPGRVELAIEARGQDYELRVADRTGEWRTLVRVDGRFLSPSAAAGDFVGTHLGMYASSQGHPSDNHADFDWFEYRELPE
jgi:alpha-N-arabinofuranosidase